MFQITHDNHFVPQLYLKQWSKDRKKIWSYRLLVPHRNVEKWKLRPISGVAFHRDLYTEIADGKEIDDFEKWLESEFESPAQDAITKVIQDKPLKSSDWINLARFLAAQDVRTPTSYLETTERWEKTLPPLMEKTIKDSIKEFEEAKRNNQLIENEENVGSLFKNSLSVKVLPNPNLQEGGSVIQANITAGRSLWIRSQRLLLQKTIKVLLNHKWSIVEPASGLEWFTSDHPVIRLNYYKEGKYDLRGGWGKAGGNLIMPLSPKHLLFTQIGSEMQDRFTFSREKTFEIQKFIAERAFRWIFAKQQIGIIEKYRPRHIDAERYKVEQEQLKKWHTEQSEAERNN